jgi:uncharacterized protein YjbI with pentapeptide repeats
MSSAQEEGFKLLTEGTIQEFNSWRMMEKNLRVKLDFSNRDFSGKDVSRAFLNGVIADGASFANADLTRSNLVQASLNGTDFQGANLNETLLMYAEMKEACLTNANLIKTNLMWANLQDADLTGSKMLQTIFVEANLQNAKVADIEKSGAYIKYAKLQGTSWFEQIAGQHK